MVEAGQERIGGPGGHAERDQKRAVRTLVESTATATMAQTSSTAMPIPMVRTAATEVCQASFASFSWVLPGLSIGCQAWFR